MKTTEKQPRRQVSNLAVWTMRVFLVVALVVSSRFAIVGWYLHEPFVQTVVYLAIILSILGLMALPKKGGSHV